MLAGTRKTNLMVCYHQNQNVKFKANRCQEMVNETRTDRRPRTKQQKQKLKNKFTFFNDKVIEEVMKNNKRMKLNIHAAWTDIQAYSKSM